MDGLIENARRASIDEAVRRLGGSAIWRASERAARTYALLELSDERDAAVAREGAGTTVYDQPVIALAVFPTVPEALPALRDAFEGPGRPAGILASRSCEGGAIVEWDPDVTAADLVLNLIDVELRRFASGRNSELLAPLPPTLAAKVAARGLQTPQITPERILELRIDGA